jgi:hypothetical protein
MNIIQGQIVDTDTAKSFLDGLADAVARTLRRAPLEAETVLRAADKLSGELGSPETLGRLLSLGVERERAQTMLLEAQAYLSRASLETKMLRELGENPFSFRQVEDGIEQKFAPLGVLTHIAAGNAAGLPAFSVLEGLLAGNINLLKLPGGGDGLSTSLLMRLIEIEPLLADYIYVFDLPSTDAGSIAKLLAASDAVAVWGSDFAVSGIRSLAPPNLQIIEWGHRLSFSWVTKTGETKDALEGVARDICETDQVLCSSPQCIYYETGSFEELKAFAGRFGEILGRVSAQYPAQPLEPGAQAEITAQLLLSGVEELLEDKKVFRGDGWSVIADMNPALIPSPMFRNVWVKPLAKDALFNVLRPRKGYLQTAGLACSPEEHIAACELLFRCGVCRVMPCGCMSSNYPGEPHDGSYALRRYTRIVTAQSKWYNS